MAFAGFQSSNKPGSSPISSSDERCHGMIRIARAVSVITRNSTSDKWSDHDHRSLFSLISITRDFARKPYASLSTAI